VGVVLVITPGPWTARKHGRGWSIHPPQVPGASLAECWRHPGQYTGLNYDSEANARLIAAAPDLLAALRALRAKLAALESPLIDVCSIAAIHGFEWTFGDWVRELEAADEAIDKAEGR
jgi:hypothetical protein